jgi:hypothetical protein
MVGNADSVNMREQTTRANSSIRYVGRISSFIFILKLILTFKVGCS